MRSVSSLWLGLLTLLLCACGPSDKARAERAERERIECLDKICDGDVEPARNVASEELIKLNGQWFIGPKGYFSNGINGASFGWWEHQPRSLAMKLPPEMQALAADGKADDFSIVIFLRSNHIPPEPHGYKLIELAEANGWVASRRTLRPGLDAVTMKHVIGPRGHHIDHVTYYVATQLKGIDGLPPVATCDNTVASSSGGTGFMWQSGIWAGTRMNQKHCADWPEIYLEIARVLQLLKKATP